MNETTEMTLGEKIQKIEDTIAYGIEQGIDRSSVINIINILNEDPHYVASLGIYA